MIYDSYIFADLIVFFLPGLVFLFLFYIDYKVYVKKILFGFNMGWFVFLSSIIIVAPPAGVILYDIPEKGGLFFLFMFCILLIGDFVIYSIERYRYCFYGVNETIITHLTDALTHMEVKYEMDEGKRIINLPELGNYLKIELNRKAMILSLNNRRKKDITFLNCLVLSLRKHTNPHIITIGKKQFLWHILGGIFYYILAICARYAISS